MNKDRLFILQVSHDIRHSMFVTKKEGGGTYSSYGHPEEEQQKHGCVNNNQQSPVTFTHVQGRMGLSNIVSIFQLSYNTSFCNAPCDVYTQDFF